MSKNKNKYFTLTQKPFCNLERNVNFALESTGLATGINNK